MKAKKLFALLLVLAMVVSLFPAVYAAETDPLSFADAKATVLTPKLDGETIIVTMYEDVYCALPNRAEDQQIAIYVPENAKADAPIIFMVNNSGWQSNSYSGRNGVENYGWVEKTRMGQKYTTLAGNYVSDSDSDAIGKALSEGYVIVSCGARSRNNGANEDGLYLGHSPATMTDTKAAFRYLRYNAELLPAGDPEKIVVTGTSGGGALSVVLSASGDSADYFESLYEIGAAGIEKKADGTYVSTISDAVWGTIAYCPITDLGNACGAYEWTWGAARTALMEGAEEGSGYAYSGISADLQNAASAELKAIFEEYVDSLGIGVTADTMKDAIIDLMEKEIAESIEEIGIEQMKKDLGDYDWLVINDDGSFTYDYEKHVLAVGNESTFKAASAFSNQGLYLGDQAQRNEDNLFGSVNDDYSPFNEYAWNNDVVTWAHEANSKLPEGIENKVGKDSTGLTWDEFMATEDGERLALQMKMTSPIQYLLSETDGTSAPNWYVRYGMYDRDSSWAIETVLYYSMLADKSIEDISFEFAWLKGHSGNYDVQEAYAWLEEQLAEDSEYTFWDLRNSDNVTTEDLTVKLDGTALKLTKYTGYYYDEDEANTLTVGPGKYGPKGDRDDCQVSIYVPAGANENSAVMFLIENGSWAQTGFKTVIEDGAALDSTTNDRIALALAHNMIVVNYGARCRGSVDKETGEIHIHAPQMIVDTKAAIRYVKYNIELGLIPGDADKVVISGHSGGGAMGSIIASTGNSSDFDKYLVNAAPATDDVFAVLASAPITDLAYADFAYEWTFGDYRAEAPYESLTYGEYDETMMALSETLAAKYVTYVEDMFGLSEEEYTAKIAELFAESVEHEMALAEELQYSDIRPETDDRGWFELDKDGNVVSFDLEAYTEWAVNNAGITDAYKGNELKGIMAFNSEGMLNGYNRNENNLWGTAAQAYSIAYPELWDMVKDPAAIGVDKYDGWDEFWAAEGDLVGMQMKAVSVMPYLTGSENMWYLEGLDDAGDNADVAPNWFIRHGMGDIDTSYAVVASLILAVEEAAEGEVNAYFGWERGHNFGGSTYYHEFFQWMEDNGWVEKLETVAVATNQTVTVNGQKVAPEAYNVNGENYFKLRDIAALLNGTSAQFSVEYIDAARAIYIVTGEKYAPIGGECVKGSDKSATCVPTNQSVIIDALAANLTAYNFDGANYFRLKDLGAALGFTVDYNAASRTVIIETK